METVDPNRLGGVALTRRPVNYDVSACGVQGSEFKPHAGNNIFFTFIVCDYEGLLLINPRNIISNIIMIENERDGNMTEVTQREDAQHTVIEPFELVEVAKQMKKMQNNKACGPDGVPTESLRLVDKIDPMLICDQMNDALEKGIPTVWRTSILTPLQGRS